MDEKLRVILIATALIMGVMLIGVGALALANATSEDFTGKTLVECTGVVEVDPLGFGKPSLDPLPTCEAVKQCPSLFSFADFFLPSVESGNVVLYVDNVARDNLEWESRIGGNIDFTLSTCVVDPKNIEVDLYDDDGTKLTTYKKTVGQ